MDVIHTDGSLEPAVVWVNPHSGDLHQLGHMDFYPSGGSEQPGCGLGRSQISGLGLLQSRVLQGDVVYLS